MFSYFEHKFLIQSIALNNLLGDKQNLVANNFLLNAQNIELLKLNNMVRFRFMDLEIWNESININDQLFDIADQLENDKKFRIAEQLRGASLSISNNIAEGSGSYSSRDFSNYLNIARRSVFEVVNILIVINRRKYIDGERLNRFLMELDMLSRKISNFRNSILKKSVKE